VLFALTRRVARNREIAGLHYESDSAAGQKLAVEVFGVLTKLGNNPQTPPDEDDYDLKAFGRAVVEARREWKP
jgi:alkyl hydroperoxide reductase subunit AhpF